MAAEHMDQVLPNLWIGDIYSAQDVEGLKANGIYSIVSAMRWRVTLHHVRLALSTTQPSPQRSIN